MRIADETGRLRQLLNHGAKNAARRQQACPGRFVSAADKPMAVHAAREEGVEAFFEGGWAEAERLQVCFAPKDADPLFTAEWVRIDWDSRFAGITHRDLLGSLMGLGIDRSYTGDLILQEDRAFLFALPELSARLPQEWWEASRVRIHAAIAEEPPVIEPPRGQMIRDTVASLRLDCILAAALRLSRARAAELIRSGCVAVDHRPTEQTDLILSADSLISIRGAGRVRLKQTGDVNRHGRTGVELECFLHETKQRRTGV